MKFLHCADIHLDMPFSSPGMTFEMSNERREDIKRVFSKIVFTAKIEKVDLLLISGDLYEHDYVRKSTIAYVNECFKEIPDIRVFMVPGNHDPYTVNSFHKTYKWADNVTILTRENPYRILEDLKVCVYGIGFKNFYEDKSLIYNIEPVKKDYINILMAHGTVDMNIKKSMYNPMSSDNLMCLGMDYIALGHFHNRIEDLGGHGSIYNPGSPEPLGFDEQGEHGFFIGDISKNELLETKLSVTYINSNSKSYVNLEVDIDGASGDQQIAEAIKNSLHSGKLKDMLYSIILKGYVGGEYKPGIPKITEYLKDMCFYLKIKDETRPDYDFDKIILEQGIKGSFTRKIFSLIDKSGDEYEKKLLLKALYYGIEAIEHGNIGIAGE